MQLIADDREKVVYPFLEKVFEKKKDQLKKLRLTRGDFAVATTVPVSTDSGIKVTIERKTLKDYAAGIKDGRYENVAELINLRKETGCLIVFIIECKNSHPSLTKKFNGMPYKNILASIDLLIFRSGIHVIYTKDPEHTALRLNDILMRYIKIENDKSKGRVSASLRHINENITEYKLVKPSETVGGDSKVPPKLTEVVEKDDDRLVREMWDSVNEISYAVAGILSQKFTVVELVNQTSIDILKSLTHESGIKFAAKIVKQLVNIKNKDKDCFLKLLCGIHKIGKASAQKIIDNVPIDDLLTLTPEKINSIKIDGKRVCAKLENIKKFFNYKTKNS